MTLVHDHASLGEITYLNTFAFLATSLCRCTKAGAIVNVCYQEKRVMGVEVWGRQGG
jgi:hypothetical protein